MNVEPNFSAAATEHLNIVKGYVDQSEVAYEDHNRGRNWIATVVYDPGAPGYLDREFWESNGLKKEVPNGLRRGDILEIAADYHTSSGNKKPDRHYFRVFGIGEALALGETKKPDEDTLERDAWMRENGLEPAGQTFEIGDGVVRAHDHDYHLQSTEDEIMSGTTVWVWAEKYQGHAVLSGATSTDPEEPTTGGGEDRVMKLLHWVEDELGADRVIYGGLRETP
jgi:hypothetical protein